MDAVTDSDVHTLVVMKSAQVGYTEIIGNIVGYFIDQDPCPILLIQPTVEMGSAWSKDRLAPMLRDTPVLHNKVKDVRAKDSGNTMLHKLFPGGHITIAGANSAAGLASRPIRILICDEPDRYPASAGTEGDPINLAGKRTTTFWNRKKIYGSTPGIKGESRIEAAFETSDQRYYMVACPKCRHKQKLIFEQLRWPKSEPEEAHYLCIECAYIIDDADKLHMIAKGEWVATKASKGIAGFHLNELYSPWVTFGEMAVSFVEAKRLPETLKTFVNTSLGKTWEIKGQSIQENVLLKRRENYGPAVPVGSYILTAGVDIQEDRFEIEVLAHGLERESWSVEYNVIYTDTAANAGWRLLDDYLLSRFEHESGVSMKISAVCIDTGHRTQEAYAYCKPRFVRRVYAIKGVGGPGKPFVGRPSRNNSQRVDVFMIGTDTAKYLLYSRLNIEEPGPGYCHFPADYQQPYFEQLTAEKMITPIVKGRKVRQWVLKSTGRRNEALDCRVYALSALEIIDINMARIAELFNDRVQARKANKPQKRHSGLRVISKGIH